MAYARLVTAVTFAHNAWLGDGSVLRDVDRLAGIPGVLVNGRFDFQAPLAGAWKLHSLWPRSELVVVNDAGHAASNRGITEELIRDYGPFRERMTFAPGAGRGRWRTRARRRLAMLVAAEADVRHTAEPAMSAKSDKLSASARCAETRDERQK